MSRVASTGRATSRLSATASGCSAPYSARRAGAVRSAVNRNSPIGTRRRRKQRNQPPPPRPMATKAPATSVVVSTYDDKRWPDLVACLESLQGQSAAPLETIVVVDHNPALLEKVSKAFPLVKVLANERPRGLAGARNTGAAAAQGEVIAFID